jgi:DNA-directed RNA polymerase I, II, and III subunit RPABC2
LGVSFGASHQKVAHFKSACTDRNSEGAIDFDEEVEPDVYEDDADQAGGGEDPEAQDPNDDNIVVTGDASAAAKDKANNTVESEKNKKVANENRTTTPYMTKYERARVLGTRALQIR